MGGKVIKLEDTVEIKINGVRGVVQGIAQYVNHPEQAWVYHLDAVGNAVHNWYDSYDLDVVSF